MVSLLSIVVWSSSIVDGGRKDFIFPSKAVTGFRGAIGRTRYHAAPLIFEPFYTPFLNLIGGWYFGH